MTPALIRFSQDVKTVLRIVEDPEVDDESRVAAAGALLHVMSSTGAIPGVRGVLRHLGDVLCIRLVLKDVRERSPEAFGKHLKESPEMFEPLSDELDATRAYLGARVSVIEDAVSKFPQLNQQGHQAAASARRSRIEHVALRRGARGAHRRDRLRRRGRDARAQAGRSDLGPAAISNPSLASDGRRLASTQLFEGDRRSPEATRFPVTPSPGSGLCAQGLEAAPLLPHPRGSVCGYGRRRIECRAVRSCVAVPDRRHRTGRASRPRA